MPPADFSALDFPIAPGFSAFPGLDGPFPAAVKGKTQPCPAAIDHECDAAPEERPYLTGVEQGCFRAKLGGRNYRENESERWQ